MNYAAETKIFRKMKPLFTNLSITEGGGQKCPISNSGSTILS